MIKIKLRNGTTYVVQGSSLENLEEDIFADIVKQFNTQRLVSVKLDSEYHGTKEKAIPSNEVSEITRS